METRGSISGTPYWMNWYSLFGVTDISVYTQQFDTETELVDLYVAASGIIHKMNMSRPYSPLLNIQNNTLAENITLSQIELSGDGSRLFACGSDANLWIYDNSTKLFANISLNVSDNSVTFLKYRYDMLLIGLEKSFIIYDTLNDDMIVPQDGAAIDAYIRCMEYDGKDVYIGTNQGLLVYSFDGIALQEVTPSFSVFDFPSHNIKTLYYDFVERGLYVGTDRGACRIYLNSGDVTIYELTSSFNIDMIFSSSGMPITNIFFLVSGNLHWLSIDYEFDRSAWAGFAQFIQQQTLPVLIGLVTTTVGSSIAWYSERQKKKETVDKSQDAS